MSSVHDGSWVCLCLPIVHEKLCLGNDRRTRCSGSSLQLWSGELLTDFSVWRERGKEGKKERNNRRNKSQSLTEDCSRANNKYNKYSYQSRKASSWKRDLDSTRVSPVHQLMIHSCLRLVTDNCSVKSESVLRQYLDNKVQLHEVLGQNAQMGNPSMGMSQYRHEGPQKKEPHWHSSEHVTSVEVMDWEQLLIALYQFCR